MSALAWANARDLGRLDPASLSVRVEGKEVGSITLEEIIALGGEEFTKVLRASGQAPQENLYTGVPLAKVLEAVIPGYLREDSTLSALAADGYSTFYSGAEVLRPEHIYLVWHRDGKKLGAKAKGGLGPLLLITRQDEYGQTWCKYLVAVDIR